MPWNEKIGRISEPGAPGLQYSFGLFVWWLSDRWNLVQYDTTLLQYILLLKKIDWEEFLVMPEPASCGAVELFWVSFTSESTLGDL